MAGDWIPIDLDLPTKREVIVSAARMRRSRHEIVGWLVSLWTWFSRETRDGIAEIDVGMLARTLDVPEAFLDCLVDIGWLRIAGPKISVVNWDRWLSCSAKARRGNALRQQIYRSTRNGSSNSHSDKSDETLDNQKGEKPVATSVATSVATNPLLEIERDRDIDSVTKVTEGSRATSSPSSPEATPSPRAPPDVISAAQERIFEAWNALPEPFPRLKMWTEKRRKALRCRLAQHGWLRDCLSAIQRIPQCPFLAGRNKRAWVANIDWLLRPDSVARVLEGAYDAIEGATSTKGSSYERFGAPWAAGPGQRNPADRGVEARGW